MWSYYYITSNDIDNDNDSNVQKICIHNSKKF